jgi:hypothetical protein
VPVVAADVDVVTVEVAVEVAEVPWLLPVDVPLASELAPDAALGDLKHPERKNGATTNRSPYRMGPRRRRFAGR